MTVTPEVRKDILKTMGKSTALFLDDLIKGFFAKPDSSEALQVLIEATALGLFTFADKNPKGFAMVQTFVYELQDIINRNHKP